MEEMKKEIGGAGPVRNGIYLIDHAKYAEAEEELQHWSNVEA